MSHNTRLQIRITGPDGERAERLNKKSLILGRSAQADIIVSNAEVSRKHLVIQVDNSSLWITDEGSKNGTFIDGVRIAAHLKSEWKVGQSLKLGLAPEVLVLELAKEEKESLEFPPPVEAPPESVISKVLSVEADEPLVHQKTVIEPNPLFKNIRVDASVDRTQELNRTQHSETLKGQTQSIARDSSIPPLIEAKVTPPRQSTTIGIEKTGLRELSKVNRLQDLEKRMQELLAKAESEARAITESVYKESQNLKENLDQSQQKAKSKAQVEASQEQVQLEKDRTLLRAEIQSLKNEIEHRLEDKKALLKKHAELKLRVQNLEAEVLRLEQAKIQLPDIITNEIAELEGERETLKKRAAIESREIIETAQRQAESLLKEAQIKAKSQLDKKQIQMADQLKSLELELSELRLKHVKEIKDLKEERDLSQVKTVAQTRVLNETQSRLKNSSKMNDTSGGSDSATIIRAMPNIAKITSVNEVEESISHTSTPPPLPRFHLSKRNLVVFGSAVVLIAVLLRGFNSNESPKSVQSVTVNESSVPSAPTSTVAPATPASWLVFLRTYGGPQWQMAFGKYLESIGVDPEKVSRYRQIEQQFLDANLALERSPSSAGQLKASEEDFVREIYQLFGSQWEKTVYYRNYYWSQSQSQSQTKRQ